MHAPQDWKSTPMSVKEKTWLNLWNLFSCFLGSVRAAVMLHWVIFTENPLKGVSTENMPLFGMKVAAQSWSLHVPTEVTESISKQVEPGPELQAYVCQLHKVTTPSVCPDQVVKQGSFLKCQKSPIS